MSVLLNACKDSRKKAIERALKKKAEKKKEKREAKVAQLVEHLGVPDDRTALKVWTFLLNGKPNSIVLYLDSLDVCNNGDYIETENDFTDNGARVSFWMGEHFAQIVTSASSSGKGLVHALTIDGTCVPE